MTTPTEIPSWETLAEHLCTSLGYTKVTLERTKYTYSIFVSQFCGTKGDAENRLEQGIERINNTFEAGKISKDKLLRLRRIAFRLLQLIRFGEITWERVPLYGKKFGNAANEELLASHVAAERREHKHAESIIKRDEHIIRTYILYAESRGFDIVKANAQNIIAFLSHMKTLRPSGLKSTTSALRHFYLYLVETRNVDPSILLAIKPWDTPHKRVYGTLSNEEKQKLLDAIDTDSDTGKRDKAIIMLAIDGGLRSSDICNLKLKDIDWRNASVNFIQNKTGNQVNLPFSKETGDALADYILNARGTSILPYVFLKKSYFDSGMTSALLCNRLKKLLQKAGINHPASEKISMHTFRRSLGTELIDSGESMEMVAQILGHKDKEATNKYISISEKTLRACSLAMPKINEGTENHG
jgi:site-specific recombinase XerD